MKALDGIRTEWKQGSKVLAVLVFISLVLIPITWTALGGLAAVALWNLGAWAVIPLTATVILGLVFASIVR